MLLTFEDNSKNKIQVEFEDGIEFSIRDGKIIIYSNREFKFVPRSNPYPLPYYQYYPFTYTTSVSQSEFDVPTCSYECSPLPTSLEFNSKGN